MWHKTVICERIAPRFNDSVVDIQQATRCDSERGVWEAKPLAYAHGSLMTE